MLNRKPRIVVYDIEIKNAIESKGNPRQKDYDYCAGWTDYQNMGIASLCAYDYAEDRYRVFMEDNIAKFGELLSTTDLLVGFNSVNFDNKILNAEGLRYDGNVYDIFLQLQISLGWEAGQYFKTGYKLDQLAKINTGKCKSGDGALAPMLFQDFKIGELIDYNLQDVNMTKSLFDVIMEESALICPLSKKSIKMVHPNNSLPAQVEELF